ncbi:cation diffusion facilitator family transporter [Marinobacter caseinilyticus]|uniref:cation diffusion facilitator family transporter n=1 Tax=Marinobacter caseinilyticus TaxID=2692195 RepID=UPI00249F5ADD|nr:cation diffusion facilitator family transporter [Marinobacter caseinilyticus]
MSQTTSVQNHADTSHATELKAATSVTIIGMVLDAALGGIKCVGGVLFHSQALIVDGIHSFTDVASDLVVLAVMKASRQAPDQSHPYGHQRIETLGTMLLGSILIAVGAALAWDNVLRLLAPAANQLPEWPVLIAALVSVAGKEWIYRYTRRVGMAIRSDLIIANAWHSRTDAMSSVVVVFSTIGAMLGYVWLDIIAAVVIAIIIARVGWRFTWDSVRELVDTALPEEDTRELTRIAMATEGVRNVHELRSRRMGHDIMLDVHLQVKPEISVSEGHQIGMQVVQGMRTAFENLKNINFHIDAENDEEGLPTTVRLPSRREVRETLAQCVGEFPDKCHLRLHYLGNHIHLELFLDKAYRDDPAFSKQHLTRQLEALPWFGSLRIWFPGEE